MTQPADLVLRSVRLADGTVADVAVTGGLVSAITAPGVAIGASSEDLAGFTLFPAFAEPHAHLDKALARIPGVDGGLGPAVAAWIASYPTLTVNGIAARARRAVLEYVANGVGSIRTHVDVGPGIGTRGIEAVARVRDELRSIVDISLVALTPIPLTGRAGAEGRAASRDAVAAGVDLIGGAPWLDEQQDAAADFLLDLAAEHGLGVDLHVDETLAPGCRTVEHLVAAVDAGFSLPVTASHVVSLGVQPAAVQRRTAAALARTGIGVVTLPRTNLWLQDRGTPSSPVRGLTAVRALLDAGVVVTAGADNLRDVFGPHGAADPLAVAQLLALVADVSADEALRAVTGGVVPLVAVGTVADLVAVQTPVDEHVVSVAPPGRVVLHRGRVVARRTVVESVWVDGLVAAVGAVTRR